MAFIRSLSNRASLVRRRYHPSFSYILHNDDQKHDQTADEGPSQRQGIGSYVQQRAFGTSFNNSFGTRALFHHKNCLHFSFPSSTGTSFLRYMSSTTIDGASDKIEVTNVLVDAAEFLTDTATQTLVNQAPAVNEVAVAAADSFFPVAALQYVIDAVHSFTGLNWWAAIALTTLMIRSATIPLLINQLKSTSKLSIIRPQLEEIKQRVQDRGMDPNAVTDGQKEMQKLFNEHGVSPFTPLKGLFIQGPVFVSFFLAISNMAEKVPSFKTGGASWFIDLTTPDNLYLFPVLTALTFLITVECNMQEGLEGNPVAGTMKNVSRGLAVASVPLTMSFPKAIFCYWVTSNLFSLTYGLVLKSPSVKKFLGIPQIPVAPPTSSPQPSLNLFAALKQSTAVKQQPTSLSSEEPPKIANQKLSSSAVISQRLRSLEKQVKSRKKNKKR
ncbi:hypothetical protein K2173_014725 [Erythroxylum novogranatense]|uniref:Membrane insertase YidC/Oxa/ALB C-terminal domain-containing protein n=1 Tax=Erythroxylum novogranatense TaxID=1862640 RepID=A0AAV8TI22_9ROSI|nr:hypothetical protein K2173_014725 [Erythroxylum novogranatense]